MKKSDYAAMFTLRADGRYQGYWHEPSAKGKGKRHIICDRDPKRLFERIQEREKPRQALFSEVLDAWEETHRDEVKTRTWANYAPHVDDLRRLYGDAPVDNLTAFDVNQDLLAAKAKGYSHSVVNARRCIWRMAFDFAIGQRLIPYNPALSVKNPKGLPKGKRSTPEEEALAVILAGANDITFGFIPFFFLCTGVRRSEGLHLRTADIDTERWELRIEKAKTAAGIRTVPIIEPLREPLKAWMAAHPGEWLFPHIDYHAGRKGGPGYMSDTNWDTAWAKFCADHGWTDEDGKPSFGAHNLRHGTATLLYEAGVDVYTAQHILGHANVNTTLTIYTELRKEHEKQNVGKFSTSIADLIAKGAKTA